MQGWLYRHRGRKLRFSLLPAISNSFEKHVSALRDPDVYLPLCQRELDSEEPF